MREQPGRTLGRMLAAALLSGAAVLAAVSPGHAATTAAARPAAAKAKYISAAGYTGPQVHGTWAGPGVGLIAWTVGTSFDAVKTNAYRSCRSNWTTVSIDVAWNSQSLHNGAKLAIINSVKLSNGKWRDAGPALVVSKPVAWPGHPAFGAQYRSQIYTPGNVHVVQGHIESWISNGGVPYTDPTGSGDTITLKQFRRC